MYLCISEAIHNGDKRVQDGLSHNNEGRWIWVGDLSGKVQEIGMVEMGPVAQVAGPISSSTDNHTRLNTIQTPENSDDDSDPNPYLNSQTQNVYKSQIKVKNSSPAKMLTLDATILSHLSRSGALDMVNLQTYQTQNKYKDFQIQGLMIDSKWVANQNNENNCNLVPISATSLVNNGISTVMVGLSFSIEHINLYPTLNVLCNDLISCYYKQEEFTKSTENNK